MIFHSHVRLPEGTPDENEGLVKPNHWETSYKTLGTNYLKKTCYKSDPHLAENEELKEELTARTCDVDEVTSLALEFNTSKTTRSFKCCGEDYSNSPSLKIRACPHDGT